LPLPYLRNNPLNKLFTLSNGDYQSFFHNKKSIFVVNKSWVLNFEQIVVESFLVFSMDTSVSCKYKFSDPLKGHRSSSEIDFPVSGPSSRLRRSSIPVRISRSNS